MEDTEDSDIDDDTVPWIYLPEAALLHIFSYLDHEQLVYAGATCKRWNAVSHDDFLWRDLFYRDFNVYRPFYPSCKPETWLNEYIRLCDQIPLIQTEIIIDHRHQVLHVSFSHAGDTFATCSKDGHVLVWSCDAHPVVLKYDHDMKLYSWNYPQFSQFNESDTLLLVSGVHFGGVHSTSGEIAVFSLDDNFQLQCRVTNKPYDVFGTWYNDRHLLSGELHWLAHLVSSTVLRLNKASQEIHSEHVPVTGRLYRFYNRSASSVKAIMVANCLPVDDTDSAELEPLTCYFDQQESPENVQSVVGNPYNFPPSFCYSNEYRKQFVSSQFENEVHNQIVGEKLLIFTTGSDTYAPHQIGLKRMKPASFPERLSPGPSLKERVLLREMQAQTQLPEPDWLNFQSVADRFDAVDHLIDLRSHIVGMALSPDHRYLYVNARAWPTGAEIISPLSPPPVSRHLDMHVIDLKTLKRVGVMLRSVLLDSYTVDDCFYVLPDVCDNYVASGGDDRYAYLWDRRCGTCLACFRHGDVVNSVAFNPKNSEMMVTVSDDGTVRVWRSRASVRQLDLDFDEFPNAVLHSKH